jgi:hypothetical protein
MSNPTRRLHAVTIKRVEVYRGLVETSSTAPGLGPPARRSWSAHYEAQDVTKEGKRRLAAHDESVANGAGPILEHVGTVIEVIPLMSRDVTADDA